MELLTEPHFEGKLLASQAKYWTRPGSAISKRRKLFGTSFKLIFCLCFHSRRGRFSILNGKCISYTETHLELKTWPIFCPFS